MFRKTAYSGKLLLLQYTCIDAKINSKQNVTFLEKLMKVKA